MMTFEITNCTDLVDILYAVSMTKYSKALRGQWVVYLLSFLNNAGLSKENREFFRGRDISCESISIKPYHIIYPSVCVMFYKPLFTKIPSFEYFISPGWNLECDFSSQERLHS